MDSWTIQRKTLVGFSAALVVLMAVIAATYFTTESFLQSSSGIWQSFEEIAVQENLYASLVDVMSDQRNYVASGNLADLDARNAALARLNLQNDRLKTMSTAAPPERQRHLKQLESAIDAQLILLDEALHTREDKEITAEKLASLRVDARNLLSTIRNELDAIEVTQRARVAQHIDHSHRAAVWLYATIGLISVLFLIGLRHLLQLIYADLDTRDEIDKRLEQTSAFSESLLENIPSMIFVKDAHTLRFLRLNQAAEQLLGVGRADLIGKSDSDLFPPEQARFFIDKDREVLTQGKILDIPSEEIDTRAQGRRILHTRKVPIRNAAGQPSMLLGISMDITEQKLAERQVLKLNTELKHKAELLLSANQELESFCYSVSHDLRAPLRGIDAFAGMLEQNHATGMDVEAQRLLKGVRKNAQRMAELIDDLLEFARLGRQPLELTTLDMTAIAMQAVKAVIEGGSDSKPKVSVEPLTSIKGDARALYHVWLNLLDNALKYSAHAAVPEVTVSAECKDHEVVYSVSDNGVGFDMQYSDKLFGVFERLHSSKEYPGTGVGLAIVQRVIFRHGGRVWAESALGQGATFYFSLPLKAG